MRLTLPKLQVLITSYIDASKVAVGWNTTTNNLVGLVDKIGKQVNLDTSYNDNLTEMDGDELPLGKTIEEYFQDLVLPTDYEDTGANTMAPAYPTYRKPTYSYTFGRKKFKTTLKFDEYERACINETTFTDLATGVLKRLYDSEATFNLWAKKELLKVVCNKVTRAYEDATAYDSDAAFEVGDYVQGDTAYGVVMRKISANEHVQWNARVANGDIVELDMRTEIARPVDTATGEAFIKQIKADIEKAGEPNEGHSFNGNTIGSGEGLILYIDFGIMPSIDVDTLAGAFNSEKLAMPVTIKPVNAFKGVEGKPFAILMDNRAVKLHSGYNATREQENADGDFINYVKHVEKTGFISTNAFIKVYQEGE